MRNAEYQGNRSCLQRDSAEHKGYAGAQSIGGQEGKEQGGADLLERILGRENLKRAYKQVKANKGAPGIDGMTVENALPWLREHREELLETIRQGKYKPQPVLAKSPRAAQRLFESTQRYLEGKLKLRMNVEKSKFVSVYSIRNFKFLGFALGKGKNGVYIRAHAKSLKKAKAKLKELTSRRQGRNVRKVMENVKVYIRGWLGYFRIASMKTTIQEWDGWLRRRFRCYIWKQWKKPRTRTKNLMKLGLPEWQAWVVGNCRKAYWHMAKNGHVQRAISKERLAQAGYYSILDRYESVHLCD